MFLLAEHFDAEGKICQLRVRASSEGLVLWRDDIAVGALAEQALVHVIRRYGRALDPQLVASLSPRRGVLSLGDGTRIFRLAYQAMVDVEPKEYLVWVPSEGEPVCALATTIGAALEHLARAAAAKSSRREP